MRDLSKFNVNDFNNLIKAANETISCGPECMNQKQSKQLQQNFLDAEINVASAPQKLFNATKDLITYTQGEAGYTTYIDNDLQKKAEAIVTMFQNKFNVDVNNIVNNIKNYQGLLINFDNIFDLYNKYKSENRELEKKLKNKSSDTLTNDRKSYYEDEGLNRLKIYYYFFLFVYIFIVVVFILSIFLVKTEVKVTSRIFILILLILYPFVCYWFVLLLHKLFEYIKRFFPMNHTNNIKSSKNNFI
jgi:predicted DNA-binding protein YlxM (UPF0122 family)